MTSVRAAFASGAILSGGDQYAYVPQSLTVQNNIIQGYSRVFADGEGVAMGNGHDVMIQHNDITDGYHAGVSICMSGCYSQNYSANGINIITQYNHIWNVMQGITSDGGALYYNTGGTNGSGTGNQILNNLVHDVTDSSIIDPGVPRNWIRSSGHLSGHRILRRECGQQCSVSHWREWSHHDPGPTRGQTREHSSATTSWPMPAESMFEEQNPWPENCSSTLKAKVTHNLFYFDLDDTVRFPCGEWLCRLLRYVVQPVPEVPGEPLLANRWRLRQLCQCVFCDEQSTAAEARRVRV